MDLTIAWITVCSATLKDIREYCRLPLNHCQIRARFISTLTNEQEPPSTCVAHQFSPRSSAAEKTTCLCYSAGECVYFQFNQFSLICETTLLRQSASSFRNICHLRTEIITLLENHFLKSQWVEMYLRKASGETLTRFANKGNFSYSRLWFARRKSQVVNPFLMRRTCYFISVISLDNFW